MKNLYKNLKVLIKFLQQYSKEIKHKTSYDVIQISNSTIYLNTSKTMQLSDGTYIVSF